MKNSLVGARVEERVAGLFRSLSHPVRLELLDELARGSARSVHALAAAAEVNSASISQQLGVLRSARLVRFERRGNERMYSNGAPDLPRLLRLAHEILTSAPARADRALSEQAEAHPVLDA